MHGDVDTGSGVVLNTVVEHLREAGLLHASRAMVSASPGATLFMLARHDERLAAHIDGLLVAGQHAADLSRDAFDDPVSGEVFPVAIVMLHRGDRRGLEELLGAAEQSPQVAACLRDAFAWVDPKHLRGIVVECRRSESVVQRLLAIDASVAHGADAGLPTAIEDRAPIVRARALRAAGEQGRRDLAERCLAATGDEDPDCRVWGAWSAVLLGNTTALRRLAAMAEEPDPHEARLFRLALQRLPLASSHALLQRLAADPARKRKVTAGSGLVGDPNYVPWLIAQMAAPETARLAGEAFSNITGLDLFRGFEVERPEGFESGPSEDPEDDDVSLDPDEGLPWPDVPKVQAWWAANAPRFQPGQRYFLGQSLTREHCAGVLRHGYQRQRVLAAHYLCLLSPGTPLFNASAPAWRQQRLLAQMS